MESSVVCSLESGPFPEEDRDRASKGNCYIRLSDLKDPPHNPVYQEKYRIGSRILPPTPSTPSLYSSQPMYLIVPKE